MNTYIIACLFLIFAAQMPMQSAANIDKNAIEQVAAGKIDTAKASWWGFDSEDSTDALQAAINSGVKTLIVDNVGKPWIVRPMTLASNQKIVFEKGVEVIAKRGEFKGRGDTLFSAISKDNITLTGYGATLRMHRSDYDRPEYAKAEWRNVLNIRSCNNIKVYGLTLAESGGDGIYLGVATKGVTNKNIHIKDVTCDRNYRQGISVISAENLLIENTILRNTDGTAPRAGIDFEPNDETERLVNVVMRKCLTQNNRGDGFQMHLPMLTAASIPVSIRFEDCKSIGDGNCSTRVTTGNTPEKAVKGSVEYINCTFERGGTHGILILDKPVGGCKVTFVNCSILNPLPNASMISPIFFANYKGATQPIGGVHFENCILRDPLNRKPFFYRDEAGGIPLQEISGTINIKRKGISEKIDITAESITK